MKNAAKLWLAPGILVVTGVAQQPQQPQRQAPEIKCTMPNDKGEVVDCGPASPPVTTPASPNAAKAFPYPGDPAPINSAPDHAAPLPANKQFPFPGEPGSTKSAPTAPDASKPTLQDAGSSGSSSDGESSSSSSSSGAGGSGSAGPFGDDDDAKPTPRKSRKKLPPVQRQTPDERELEDVKIAAFYQNDGNYKAAYMRGKDAVSLTEDDPDAHFALAEAARKLGKFDEAQQHYKRCLELDPVPKVKKVAQTALKEMAGGG